MVGARSGKSACHLVSSRCLATNPRLQERPAVLTIRWDWWLVTGFINIDVGFCLKMFSNYRPDFLAPAEARQRNERTDRRTDGRTTGNR